MAAGGSAYAGGLGSLFGWLGFNDDRGHDPKCYVHCVANAPEIDPASALSALTLLGGGLLVLRGRGKKK